MGAPLEKTSVPGIYRRGSRYVLIYRDPTGKQRQRSVATLAEGRSLKAELSTDMARGEYREQARLTFAEYAREWVRTYTGRTSSGIRPTTLLEYDRDLQLHVLPLIGRRRMTQIEPRHIKLMVADLAAAGSQASTVRNIMAPVRALFATAVEEGIIRSSPCSGLRLAGNTRTERHARALTEDEFARLLVEVQPEHQLLVSFLAQTGLRVGELIALRWSDVDLEARRIHVRRRIYRHTVDAPKSRYGVRDVPISKTLTEALRSHYSSTPFNADGDPLFATTVGTVNSASNLLRRVIKPAAARAGVPWAGLHTLRHTCASMLFRSGWNAKQVQMVLGHHSPAFTLATYVHLIPDDLPEPVFRDDVMAHQAAAARPARRARRVSPSK